VIDLYEAIVFCDEKGHHGDKHGIIIDEEQKIHSDERQKIATDLGYAETIFINDIDAASISFFAKTEAIPFAGTAALAAARMLQRLSRKQPALLKTMDNAISLSFKGNEIWVDANISIMPRWNHLRLESVVEVERITLEESNDLEHTMVWAWSDRKNGVIRARTFAPDWMLPEVEANGSGSMILANRLDRRIVVIHGVGSKIFAESKSNDTASLGGRVAVNEMPIRKIRL
jgi:predicted PhzF superfamily epimerase YddE/YHI9